MTVDLHKPPSGTTYKHYKDGSLYRVLFSDVGTAPVREGDRADSIYICDAMVATNGHSPAYETARVFTGSWGLSSCGLWTYLPYPSIVYVSQKTLCIYIREANEFYETLLDGVDGSIRRFQVVP